MLRRRLLQGLDDIGATLTQEQAISVYEGEREDRVPPIPVATAL